jgi:hypothetical protein
MHAICTSCGTQFAASAAPPAACPVCDDERQFVGWAGQEWTTLEDLRVRHRLALEDEGDGLLGIGCEPRFAIGQRALLVPAQARGGAGGTVLWDCISLIDDAAVRVVEAQGGLSAIAISHPHYYTTMVEWSRAFGGVPIYLHADERDWVRPDPAIVLWQGEQLDLGDGLTLLRRVPHPPLRRTLRMLINCTSGYADYVSLETLPLYEDVFRQWTPDELIAITLGSRWLATPAPVSTMRTPIS